MINDQQVTDSALAGEGGHQISAAAMKLAALHLGVSADDLRVSKLAGDASSRAYFRVRTTGHSNGKGPASLVLVLYPEPFDETEPARARLARLASTSPTAKLTFASDPKAHIEVTALFLEAGLPVPQIVSVSGPERVILFEDLGDLRLQDWLGDKLPGEIRHAYRRALELLVEIQDNTGRAIQGASICSALAFDKAKLEWELKFFLDNYFGKYVAARVPSETMVLLNDEISSLCRELASGQQVLTHRDYHARNLMMQGDEMYIIDHQDARLGPRSYDLVSLLYDPYATIGQDIVDELTESFIELNAKSAMPFESECEFRRESELATVQRLLKASGTYAFQAAVKKHEVYVQYLAPALGRALAALERLGRFDNLRRLIESTVET
jgi:aminoglycoside/choline kinase family phosphotransferase